MGYSTYQAFAVGLLAFLFFFVICFCVMKRIEKKAREREEREAKEAEKEDASWHIDPFEGAHEEKKPETKTEEKKASGVKVKYGRGYGGETASKEDQKRKSGIVKETEELYRLEWGKDEKISCPGCGVENPTDNRKCLLCGRILSDSSKEKN